MLPKFTIREYHPVSGALLGNTPIIDFGKISAGTRGRVKVIDIVFNEVSNVGNLKIGIVSTGGVTVTNGSVGHFGITDSSSFDPSIAAGAISSHFLGVNTTDTASDPNNVSIGMKSATISNYIYLDVEVGSTNLSAGNGAFKIYCDSN